jgi:hypothetical protein
MAEKRKRVVSGRGLMLLVGGIAAIIIVNIGLSAVITRSITEAFLTREGLVNQEFLNSILASENSADKLFTSSAPSAALLSFSSHVRSLPGIVRANIYSPDGFIRHSTDPNLVGLHFSDNAELAESFTGKITAALETVRSNVKPEHLALNQLEGDQFIEAYIPVSGPDKKVVAVVEFYRTDEWVKNTISTIERSVWMATALSSAILALALLIAMRSSGRLSAKVA